MNEDDGMAAQVEKIQPLTSIGKDRNCRTCYVPSLTDCKDGSSVAHEVDTSAVAVTSMQVSAPSPPWRAANLSGTFVLEKIEGDMDVFLQDGGVGYMMRTAASTRSYGVGSSKHTIKHDGNRFTNQVDGVPSYLMEFTIGGGPQKVMTADGSAMLTPTWFDGGNGIQTEGESSSGSPKPVVKYSLNTGQLIIEMSSPKGTAVKHIFKKEE